MHLKKHPVPTLVPLPSTRAFPGVAEEKTLKLSLQEKWRQTERFGGIHRSCRWQVRDLIDAAIMNQSQHINSQES